MIRGPFLVFIRGATRFALPATQIHSVKRLKAKRPVPQPSRGVIGLLPADGHLFTLIETQLPAPAPTEGDRPRFILIDSEAHFGFRVDHILGIKEADAKGRPMVDFKPGPWAGAAGACQIDGQETWLINVDAMVPALEAQ